MEKFKSFISKLWFLKAKQPQEPTALPSIVLECGSPESHRFLCVPGGHRSTNDLLHRSESGLLHQPVHSVSTPHKLCQVCCGQECLKEIVSFLRHFNMRRYIYLVLKIILYNDLLVLSTEPSCMSVINNMS